MLNPKKKAQTVEQQQNASNLEDEDIDEDMDVSEDEEG